MSIRSALLPASVFLISLLTAAASPRPQQKPLTVEEIFSHGSLIGTPPRQLTWSPDGKHLTYIDDSGEMIEVDAGTGRTHVLISRQKLGPLTREGGTDQQLEDRSRYHMASYFWAPDSKHLMFDSQGRLWIYSLENGTGVEVGYTGSDAGDDPKFSPDGTMASFVRDHGLAVLRLRDPGTPTTTVVSSPKPDIVNGEVDWLYEEELDVRSNYFWSPDSRNLAFLQMDEVEVPHYPLEDWIPVHATVYAQPYPQPGDPNPEVRVGVVSAKGGRVVWARVPITEGADYIPRFGWVDAKTLWVETLSRDQKHRAVYFVEANSGDAIKMLEIDDDKFVDDNYDVSVGHGDIVLANWMSGHNQLYLYGYNAAHPLSGPAKLAKQLTSGDFEVGKVYNVDYQARLVDYASNQGDPLGQQLWEVGFDGNSRELTRRTGFHIGEFASAGGNYVDTESATMNPPTVSVCREVEKCRVFWQTRALESYQLRAPEQLKVKAQDGTTLYATLLLPEGSKSNASVPLIVNPYGGPDVQNVQNRWSDDLFFDELLAQHGFAVLHADNRGMAGRGRAFAQAAYHNFGPVQLEDQLAVIDAVLKQYPELDPKRMGWWGWSWGGTFTIYAMTHSDRFDAGVAVAPVTNWRNYDSVYTERYLGTPSQNQDSYRDFSVVSSAANLKGHLLLVHGTGDDNVHLANTVQFIQALDRAAIPYELRIFPRKAHSLTGPKTRTELYKMILEHFERYLMPPGSGVN